MTGGRNDRAKWLIVGFVAGAIIGPVAWHLLHLAMSSTKDAQAISAVGGLIGCVTGTAGVAVAWTTLGVVRKNQPVSPPATFGGTEPQLMPNGAGGPLNGPNGAVGTNGHSRVIESPGPPSERHHVPPNPRMGPSGHEPLWK